MAEGKAKLGLVALVLAGAGLLASWVPFVGLLLALSGVVAAVLARRQGQKGHLGVASFALVLAAGYTTAWVGCTAAEETPEERRAFEGFDDAFEPGAELPPGAGDPNAPSPAREGYEPSPEASPK